MLNPPVPARLRPNASGQARLTESTFPASPTARFFLPASGRSGATRPAVLAWNHSSWSLRNRDPFTSRIFVDSGEEWGDSAKRAIHGVKRECGMLRYGASGHSCSMPAASGSMHAPPAGAQPDRLCLSGCSAAMIDARHHQLVFPKPMEIR